MNGCAYNCPGVLYRGIDNLKTGMAECFAIKILTGPWFIILSSLPQQVLV